MIRRITIRKSWPIKGLVCLLFVLASCGEFNEGTDGEFPGGANDPGTADARVPEGSGGAVTCPAVFSRFPVDGAHNISYLLSAADCPTTTTCNLYCPPQAQTVANDVLHYGAQDIFAARGTPVVAAQNGTTAVGFSDSLGGNVVYINDDCGWYHYYAHLDSIDPVVYNGGAVGLRVTAGQRIGTVGNTGSASNTSPHLHYALYDDAWSENNPFNGLTSIEYYSCTANFPDLTPTVITKSVSTINAGTVVTFDSGVTNSGATDSGSFYVKWYVDGVQVGAGGHVGVPANSTVMNDNSSFIWTATAGTHTIRFVVDADNHVLEKNEANNSTQITVTVYSPGTFSGLSATLGCTATFNFSYSGTSPSYSVDLGLNPDLVNGTYLNFGSGSSSPITVSNPTTKWGSYTHGRTLYYRVYNHDRSRQSSIMSVVVNCPTTAPTPTPTPSGTFSGLSANLGCTAYFYFTYSGSSPSYRVDLGLAPDLVTGTYLDFGTGTGSPITVTNPTAKWSSYAHGRTLYYRVYNSDKSRQSAIMSATVNCPSAAPTPTPTPGFTSSSASLGCTASFNFVYTGVSPSYSVDLSLTSNFSSGVYLNFASGSGSPLTVSNPGVKWWNGYTQGRTLYYRIWNSDKSKSHTGSAVVNCTTNVPGTFSNLSATLGCTASFNFNYSGYSPSYIVDLSLTSNFSSGVYLTFGSGPGSPVTVSNPKTKWSSYTHGRTLYYRIYNSTKGIMSPIYAAVVNCP